MTPRFGPSKYRNGIIRVVLTRKGWSRVNPSHRVAFSGPFNTPVDCLIFCTLRGGNRIPEIMGQSLKAAQLASKWLSLGFPENGAWDKDLGAGGLFGQQMRSRSRR